MITDDPPLVRDLGGGRIESVYLEAGSFTATLPGPANSWRKGDPEALVLVLGKLDRENRSVWLEVSGQQIVLDEGQWSDWVTIEFE